MKRLALLGIALLAASAHAQERGAAALGRLVDGLGTSARVLVVAAHPDDEDTRLITLLAQHRHVETAYLSLTRGDGGQNLIGNELGEALGAIRTGELRAARHIDGGHQFFGREFDFGFSKTAQETFQHWPHDTVLGDVVKIVRTYRPQVMIAMWTGTARDGHGHHQASGIVAREAYDASADTVRFPRATYGAPWAVPKFYRSTSYIGDAGSTLRYDAGAYDPLAGRSYAEIAAQSRSQHKSQGQGGLERKGVSFVTLRREASRVNEGTPAASETDLFDGIDTTAAGLVSACAGTRAVGDSLGAAVRDVQRTFDARRPETLVAPLARVRQLVTACRTSPDPRAADLRDRVDAALALATGVAVEAEAAREVDARKDTIAAREVVTLGESMAARVTVYDRGARPVQVAMGLDARAESPTSLQPDSSIAWPITVRGAEIARARRETGGAIDVPSQPWWLTTPRVGDMFTATGGLGIDESRDAGLSVPVTVSVPGVPGATFIVRAPVVYRYADPVKGDVRRPVATAPAISVTLDQSVEYARAGVPFSRDVHVHLRSASTASREAVVRLVLPRGLRDDSAARHVTLDHYDAQADVAFRIAGTVAQADYEIGAVVESSGERFATGYQLIDYDHIEPVRLYHAAQMRLSAVTVALPANTSIAYVQGVGDNVAPMLAQLGLTVTMLDPSKIATTDLSRFGAVVIGQRAYDASDALIAQNPALFAWARNGGTLVVQGGQREMLKPNVMPFPIDMPPRAVLRVTHPEVPVTFVDATTSVLASPNRISAEDFAGWVQERARYMPSVFDPAYRAPLSMADPGEEASRAALLVAPLGKGTYVYTSLSFFRQLPNGNAGAARLFMNLLAAKARPKPPLQ